MCAFDHSRKAEESHTSFDGFLLGVVEFEGLFFRDMNYTEVCIKVIQRKRLLWNCASYLFATYYVKAQKDHRNDPFLKMIESVRQFVAHHF